jgi:hypothetical protein
MKWSAVRIVQLKPTVPRLVVVKLPSASTDHIDIWALASRQVKSDFPSLLKSPCARKFAAVGVDRSQPRISMARRSGAVTAFTTPALLKARNESFPALAAQSPKSPPGLVLKLSRLVLPPSREKYPGVVPTKSRTPGAE